MARRGRGRPPHPDVLTPAEWRILREVRRGATNAEIAVRLGLGLATVKFHIRNIRAKLQVDDRDELTAWQGEPQPEPQPMSHRWLLAPLGLIAGFWKPAVAGVALTVVGGGVVAGGLLAYTIASNDEVDPPGSPLATATTTATPAATPVDGGDATPATTPTPTPVASPTPTPAVSPTPTPAASPTPTPAASPTPTPTPESEETPDVPSPPDESSGDGPQIRFWGDVPADTQAELRGRVADIVTFYDERFGIRVPGLSIHIAADNEELLAAVGGPLEPSAQIHAATYDNGAVFVHATRTADWIERFYFEAFQERVAGGRDLGAQWLAEGSAMYMGHLFRAWRGEKTLADALALVTWAASFGTAPLEDLEGRSPTAAQLTGVDAAASTATLATEWLVSRAGEAALLTYYEALPSSESWEEAFEETFGLSPEDAYEGVAAHRAAVLVERWAVLGVVRGPDNKPVEGADLFVYGSRVDGSGSEGWSVERNGGFRLRAPAGTYRLVLLGLCGFERSIRLGWYEEESGFTTNESEATLLVVDGEDIGGIIFRLPAEPEELTGCEGGS